jgi:hypothetical protein
VDLVAHNEITPGTEIEEGQNTVAELDHRCILVNAYKNVAERFVAFTGRDPRAVSEPRLI